jgi:ArsR family transcriptional regulator
VVVAITALVERLKVLADMTRLKILKLLIGREYCVCELAEIVNISQPGISQHLRKLKVAGFVTERKEGQWVYYKADERALRDFQTDFSRFLDADLDAIPEMEEELEKAQHLGENPVVIACKSGRTVDG